VYDVAGGNLLGASEPFMLPQRNQTTRVKVGIE